MTAKMAALLPVYPLSCDFFFLFLLPYEDERLSVPSRLPLPGENVARGEMEKNCNVGSAKGESASSPQRKAAAELAVMAARVHKPVSLFLSSFLCSFVPVFLSFFHFFRNISL